MSQFPDESTMARSEDGSEPIRGGSIGLNNILTMFVKAADTDSRPRFHGAILSAYTLYRNLRSTPDYKDANDKEMEQAFVKEVTLFCEYFSTYLQIRWPRAFGDQFCPVLIYFPIYDTVDTDIKREFKGKREELDLEYRKFRQKHGLQDREVSRLEKIRCFFSEAGTRSYPHLDVARKFREIASLRDCAWGSGDPVCLLSHITLDLYLAGRLRGVKLLRSNTAEIVDPKEFKRQIDPEGSVPFQSAPHVVLGDKNLLKPLVKPKLKADLLAAAEKEKWSTLPLETVRRRVADLSGVSLRVLAQHQFE